MTKEEARPIRMTTLPQFLEEVPSGDLLLIAPYRKSDWFSPRTSSKQEISWSDCLGTVLVSLRQRGTGYKLVDPTRQIMSDNGIDVITEVDPAQTDTELAGTTYQGVLWIPGCFCCQHSGTKPGVNLIQIMAECGKDRVGIVAPKAHIEHYRSDISNLALGYYIRGSERHMAQRIDDITTRHARIHLDPFEFFRYVDL